jgi:hypothetical protein
VDRGNLGPYVGHYSGVEVGFRGGGRVSRRRSVLEVSVGQNALSSVIILEAMKQILNEVSQNYDIRTSKKAVISPIF